MLSMLTDSALSDVCLVVEGIEVPSHKAVLGERRVCVRCLSPIFLQIFPARMMQGSRAANSIIPVVIFLLDCSLHDITDIF